MIRSQEPAIMQIPIDEELRRLCSEIASEQRSEDEWSLIESDDMFQTAHFIGGFDATERAFCFSYYDGSGTEFWFQLTLSEALRIAGGEIMNVNGRTPR
jgi:hypothetical protein